MKLYSSHGSGGNGKDGLLLKVNVSRDLVTIENEKDFHGGMADPLVTVNKGMALDERKAECGGLSSRVGYKSAPSKVANGCASADSRRGRSRTPEAPPETAMRSE